MATRRLKSARKGKARQLAKKTKVKVVPKRPRQAPKKRTLPKPRPKKRTPPKPRTAPKKRPKPRSAPKAPKPAKLSKAFQRVRASALRGKKFPKPSHPKRRGKSTLRGVDGQERSITVQDLWENVREGWIEEEAQRVFQRLFALFTAMRPTMYARFTFMVRGVKTEFKLGSPPLIHANAGTVRAWFTRTPVSYTVEGVMHYFRQTWDAIEREIKAAERDNPAAVFFLEYITLVAYVNVATS